MKNEGNVIYLSTGELSKQLNISVRTIRYYDQIGLIKPSKKASAGKRYYSQEDIMNLEKILLLKSLNLSLEDSKKILAEQSMSDVLLAHKSLLQEQLYHLNNSLQHTQSLLNILDLEGAIHWEDLISLVVTSKEEKDWSKYFSLEEQSLLKSQLPKLENDELTTKKWINLIKRIELCLEKKISPQSEEGQLIVEDLNILTAETFGNNDELIEAFWEVRKSESASQELGLYPIDASIIEFLELASKEKGIMS